MNESSGLLVRGRQAGVCAFECERARARAQCPACSQALHGFACRQETLTAQSARRSRSQTAGRDHRQRLQQRAHRAPRLGKSLRTCAWSSREQARIAQRVDSVQRLVTGALAPFEAASRQRCLEVLRLFRAIVARGGRRCVLACPQRGPTGSTSAQGKHVPVVSPIEAGRCTFPGHRSLRTGGIPHRLRRESATVPQSGMSGLAPEWLGSRGLSTRIACRGAQ